MASSEPHFVLLSLFSAQLAHRRAVSVDSELLPYAHSEVPLDTLSPGSLEAIACVYSLLFAIGAAILILRESWECF